MRIWLITVYRNPTSPFWDLPRPKIGSFSATRSVRQAEITNRLLLISTFISLIASQTLTSGSSVSKVSFWKGVSRSRSGELFVCSRMAHGVSRFSTKVDVYIVGLRIHNVPCSALNLAQNSWHSYSLGLS